MKGSRVIAAYEKIGRTPCAWHYVSGDEGKCSVGELSRLADEEESEIAYGWFSKRLGLGISQVRGLIAGFDWAGFEPDMGSVYEESYDIGVAIAELLAQRFGGVAYRIK